MMNRTQLHMVEFIVKLMLYALICLVCTTFAMSRCSYPTPHFVTHTGSNSEIAMFAGDKLFFFRRPKSILHYPRFIRKVPLENCPILKEITSIYFYHSKWYAVKNGTNNKYSSVTFTSLISCKDERTFKDSPNVFETLSFLERRQSDAKLGSAFIAYATKSKPILIIYQTANERLNPIILDSENHVADNAIIGIEGLTGNIDVFDQHCFHSCLGFQTTSDNTFRIFEIRNSSLHRTFSPYFKNDAIFGCPIDVCFYSAFDSAVYIHNKQRYFAGRYYWDSDGASSAVDLVNFIKVDGYDNFNYTDDVFRYKNETFVLIDGDIFTLMDDEEMWTKTDANLVFGIDINVANIDAVSVIGQVAFVFTGAAYYVIELDTLTLSNNYVSTMEIGNEYYPRPIDDFPTFPSFIDAAIVIEEKIYFLHGAFLYKLTNWTGMYPVPTPTLHLIQVEVFSCLGADSTHYNDMEHFKSVIFKLTPKPYKRDNIISINYYLNTLGVTIFTILAVGVLVNVAVYIYFNVIAFEEKKILKKQKLSHSQMISSQLVSKEAGVPAALNSKID